MATSVTLKPNAIDISGSTSGTTTLQASAVAGTTTLTLPAATDTLVGKATTDTLTNKTLTGAAMNGTLGATTPSTASVTTLTTSSTVTHSGGTANGVAYLDGSKVLTTGSALVFDGTNLGVGVTPSTWSTAYSQKAFQFGPVGSLMSLQASTTNNQTYVNSNAVNLSGGWTYLYSDYATQYRQYAGTHAWFNAPSGTAGNAITFTQAMTLDASGNLGVGTSSPAAKFDAFQASTGTYFLGGGGDNKARQLAIKSSTTTNSGDTHTFDAQSGTGILAFATTGTERARIDSSGNLLVGTTSSFSARLAVKDSTSNGTTNPIVCKNSSDTTLFYISSNGYFVTGTGANSPYNLTTASGANVTIESDGVLKRSTSSLKYKTDVQDATHGLADVLQLRPVTYKGKNDGNKVFGGLIAEEVHEAGLTEFVQYAEDGTPDALAYGNMVSLCIKAIQEQQALITQLQADVAALKGA